MLDRIAAATLALTLAAPFLAAPAAAAGTTVCTTAVAGGSFAKAWRALGAQNGPLGCPARSASGGRQIFAHGAIAAAPALGASATLTTYLRDGSVHVAIDGASVDHARYQLQVGATRGDSTFYNLTPGASSATVAAAPAARFPSFTVTIYGCDLVPMQALVGPSYVCNHSGEATTVSAPLELAMDPASRHTAVALRR